MAVATFDTLKFSKTLKAAGVPEQQAEAEANALSDIFAVNFRELVTKDDLRLELSSLKLELKNEINTLRMETKNEIASVKSEMREMEQRLTARTDVGDTIIRGEMAVIRGEMAVLKWMMGVVITMLTMLLGIGIRFLLFPR